MRRAALAIQFNWIFVLLVGIVLFGFFLVLAGKQRDYADDKTARTLANTLDTILKTRSSNLVTPLSLPKTELALACDLDDGTSTLRTGALSKDTRYQILFGAARLDSPRLHVWSTLWKAPLAVAPVVHLVEPGWQLLVLDDEAGQGATLHRAIPGEFGAVLVPADAAPAPPPRKATRYTVTTLRSWDGLPERRSFNLNAFVSAPTTTVEILAPPERRVGLLRFSAGREGFRLDTTTYFVGDELLFGALTADSPEQYRCNLGKALFHLRHALDLARARLEILVPADDPCAYLYGAPAALIDEILATLASPALFPAAAPTEAELFAVLQELDGQLATLSRLNANVNLGHYGCPYLF